MVAVDVGEGLHECQLVDPVLLPWSLALAAGVGARPHDTRQQAQLPEAVLESAYDRTIDGQDPSPVLAEHLSEEVVVEVAELLDQRRATWRATSRMNLEDSEPDVATTFTVLDGGVAGYYTMQVADGTVTLTPAPGACGPGPRRP